MTPWLQQTGLGEREGRPPANDEVVQQADIHTLQGRFQALGEHLVRRGRLGVPRGMVMRIMCPVFLCVLLGRSEPIPGVSEKGQAT